MIKQFIRSILIVAIAVSLCGSANAADYTYKADNGPFEIVEIDDMTLVHKDGRKTPIKVRSPKNADGKFPLIVFSHGAGGSKDAFAAHCTHWASHGYVVVNPTHSDSVKLRKAAGENFDIRNKDIVNQIVDAVRLQERVADVSLIITSIDSIEDRLAANGAKAEIDKTKTGLVGHSAGAMTTGTAAGVRFYPKGLEASPLSAPIPEVDAFIFISGPGTARSAIYPESFSEIESPLMVFSGSEDYSPPNPDETPQGRTDIYKYAPKGDKYLVFIDGATHSSYSGERGFPRKGQKQPDNPQYIVDIVSFSTTAFFDAFLKDDKTAASYLKSKDISRYPGGKTDYEYK